MRLASSQDRPGTVRADSSEDVSRALAGDVSAFERLYHAHVPRVRALARRMAGPQDADELTQDIFVRTWQKLSSFRGDAAFSTWLHRLAVNVIIERLRRSTLERSRRVDDSTAAYETARAATSAPALRMGLDAAIDLLPPGARQVFVLYDVEGHTHPEISEMLGISVGTSKTQLHRARMTLRGTVSAPRES
jgi:RNA polymerase sigma-70 factor (ECF subfamily)